jgi:non-ribosomal peptide synthetase component F
MTTVSIQLPEAVLAALGNDADKAAHQALEALVVDLYRNQQLTYRQVSQALGLSRYETDGVLKRHCVTEDLLGVEEFNGQAEA